MPKTYSPFIEVTRTAPVEGLSTISLINVDNITVIRCLDDGRAELFFASDASTPQTMIPVENYNWFVSVLTELTGTLQPTEGEMPSKTAKQAKFMRAVAHGMKPKSGKGPSVSVAKEFAAADKGKQFTKGKGKR